MRCADVNVLVYAHRTDAPDHERYRSWLEEARTAAEPLGVIPLVLSGFIRVVTHPKAFQEPTPLEVALAFADEVRTSRSATPVIPGPRHWSIFGELCRAADVTGNTVNDAFLAAIAIEQDATLVTADRGFARFPGLRCEHPLG
jgi:uncharacterized protein